jgi:hypothetical protein
MSRYSKQADNAAPAPEPPLTILEPDETMIGALAYQLWLERGCPIGSDQGDWFRVQEMLRNRSGATRVQ